MRSERIDEGIRGDTIEVIVVSSPACHFCEEAVEALQELHAEFPLSVRVVDIRSEEGAAVERQHRPPMPPVVLVDGEFFSFGRLPRKKLRKFLAERVS